MEKLTRTQCMKLLLTCMDLFQPENCGYYACFSPNGALQAEHKRAVPEGFPEDPHVLLRFCTEIYNSMGKLHLPEAYLKYPNFDEMKARADTLSFEDCAQFLLFWSRANLKYGQEFFYKTWQEGTVLRVLRRMVRQLEGYQFPEEQPVLREYASIQPELGDLTAANVDVVVNPTNTHLYGSGGVEQALHHKAGPELREFCKRIGQLPVSGMAWTSAFGLPAESIIHVAVPSQGHPGAPYLLAACYANPLNRVKDDKMVGSIAFSAMGTGSAGIPPQEALRIGAQTLWNWTRRNPREKALTVKVLFTSEEKLEYFQRELMLSIVREFRRLADPANLGAELLHTLPFLLEERGGLVALPPEKKCHADLGREAFYELHHRYSELMKELYSLIGSPDYREVVSKAVQRVAPGNAAKIDEAFLDNLDQMELEECICYLVWLQRMDYGSGGTAHTHIRNCSNGNVYRVLGRMEWLLKVE